MRNVSHAGAPRMVLGASGTSAISSGHPCTSAVVVAEALACGGGAAALVAGASASTSGLGGAAAFAARAADEAAGGEAGALGAEQPPALATDATKRAAARAFERIARA